MMRPQAVALGLGLVVIFAVAMVAGVGGGENVVPVAQAGSSEGSAKVPWGSIVTGTAVLLTTIITLIITNLREAKRLEVEGQRHRADLREQREARLEQGEEQRFAKLREERLKAYAVLNEMTSTFDPNEYVSSDLRVTLSQIELLSDDESVLATARSLVGEANKTRKLVRDQKKAKPDEDPAQDPAVQEAVRTTEMYRASFLNEAKRELEYTPPSPTQRKFRRVIDGFIDG